MKTLHFKKTLIVNIFLLLGICINAQTYNQNGTYYQGKYYTTSKIQTPDYYSRQHTKVQNYTRFAKCAVLYQWKRE
jgi:hypothetical protein